MLKLDICQEKRAEKRKRITRNFRLTFFQFWDKAKNNEQTKGILCFL
jgi:hypothetical protein